MISQPTQNQRLKTASDSLKKEEKNNIKTRITEKKAFRSKQN
jgi:hypothetical protein